MADTKLREQQPRDLTEHKKRPQAKGGMGLELVQQSVSEDDRPVTILAGATLKINEVARKNRGCRSGNFEGIPSGY